MNGQTDPLSIVCAERRRGVDEFTAIVERWGNWSDGCCEFLPFCPECATREFAPDSSSTCATTH